MESGKRWNDEDIPKSQWHLPGFLWFPAAELYGIQRVEYLDDVVLIGVDADLAGDGQCLLDNIGGGELGMAQQRPRSGLCICTSRADGDDPVLGLENVAGAGNDQRRSVVGDGQHGFEPAQNSVGAPVLGQFDRRALQLSLVLVELRLEALKQRECVRGGARKTRQHSVVEEPAYLARGRFNDDVAERHLAIAAERHAGTAPNRQYGSAVKDFHVRNEEEVRRRSRSEGVSSTAPGD